MKRKNPSVEMHLHQELTSFLFWIDDMYRDRGQELVITSGSESLTRHGFTSLHYATPAQAVDIRIRNSTIHYKTQQQDIVDLAKTYCKEHSIPANWFDVILESDHVHLEYQPKRLG